MWFNVLQTRRFLIIEGIQACAVVEQLKRLKLKQKPVVKTEPYLCVHTVDCRNEHQSEADSNSMQSEKTHIGLVCCNLHYRSVVVVDDNKLVVVLELQAMGLQTVFFRQNVRNV